MPGKVYALLVGINDYLGGVPSLQGCVNDVESFHDFLKSRVRKQDLAVEVLNNQQATRDGVLKAFKDHLIKNAQAGDTAVFHYCGHGAQSKSASEFSAYFPDGLDEGLVCHDSRTAGKYDLADKELAVLLNELAARDPHIAVILDCCHSGSGTRDIDEFNHLVSRFTGGLEQTRPLESYRDGFYARLLSGQKKPQKQLLIPSSRHILLAACEPAQTAKEDPQKHQGVFTSTLTEVLNESKGDISYANLFMRSRTRVRKRAFAQDPQFETFRGFNAYDGFLGIGAGEVAKVFPVYQKKGEWVVDCGAIHGLPTEPEKHSTLTIFKEGDTAKALGSAVTAQVGADESTITLDFEGDQAAYQAQITSLPVPPMLIYGEGDIAPLKAALNPSHGVDFVEQPQGTRYAVVAEGGQYRIKNREEDSEIWTVPVAEKDAPKRVFDVLAHILRWERSLALENHSTNLPQDKIEFSFAEVDPDNKVHPRAGSDLTLDWVKVDGDWQDLRYTLTAGNKSESELYFTMLYFSERFGISTWKKNIKVPAGETVILWGGGPYENDSDEEGWMFLPDELNRSVDHFKLLASEKPVETALLEQEELSATRAAGRRQKKALAGNDWLTKTIRTTIVRRLDKVGREATVVKGSSAKFTIEGHDFLEAGISITPAQNATRSLAGGSVYDLLNAQLGKVPGAAATRSTDGAAGMLGEEVLEISDIPDPDGKLNEKLWDKPLRIKVDMDLKEGEVMVPVTFDGEHILFAGDTDGSSYIDIDYIPDSSIPDNRRSLGKALKLYFFKTYLKQEDINDLCWVEYKEDGSIERHETEVASKVAAAKNILLCVHGIIGDTTPIATGLRLAKGEDGKTLDQAFDLVLTYDYENLSNPISKTAQMLKKQLETVGLNPNDDKRLTLLVHSMGGLVSRWFIEREGGKDMVDHLVMCGTPNVGSPFGMVDYGRKLLSMLASVSVNFVPAVMPALVGLIQRSRKITVTLEQMNPKGDFIKELNASDDPGIPYTILAGEVQKYSEPSDKFFPKLIARAGKDSMLLKLAFSGNPHDIAVSVNSILGVGEGRTQPISRTNVACHHLNYFDSEAGLKALLAVDWTK